MDFAFHTTARLVFREGAAEELGPLCAPVLPRGPVLFVTDAPIRGLGLAEGALASLAAAGYAAVVFDGVTPDPPAPTIERAAALARTEGVVGVVGFGGGSVMDTAKLAAYLARSGQPLDALYGVDRCTDARLPLVCVPTTGGTGSEVTPISVVTKSAEEKMGVSAPQLMPDLAVLDPVLSVTVPADHTAATGIDAMVHAIEAFTSRLKKNPVSDALALEALRLLSAHIRRAVAVPEDRAARGGMLLGSMLAGKAFANAPCAAVHALAYPLGARFHLPHGLSNALLLPAVLRFNREAVGEAYARLGAAVFGAADAGALIDGLARLGPELGLPARLSAAGIGEADLPVMARDAMAQTRLLGNNPRPVAEADALAIYRDAF